MREASGGGSQGTDSSIAGGFRAHVRSEIVQWMQDRQADLQDASRTGNASEVTRLCHVTAETASAWPNLQSCLPW